MGVADEDGLLSSRTCRVKRLKQHPRMRLGGRHVCGLDGPEVLSPTQRFQGRNDGR